MRPMRHLRHVILGAPLFAFTAVLACAAPDLTTLSERTEFRQTGRYEEVERLAGAFAKVYPKDVRVVRFGTTPEGRPMIAIVATSPIPPYSAAGLRFAVETTGAPACTGDG